jgi:rubredoxin
VGFLTLRAHWDPGAQYVPASKEKLVSVPNRKPWQVTEAPRFEGNAEINIHTFNEIRDERGLAAYSLKLKPGVKTAGPDASNGNGQYIIVTQGSLNYQGREYKAISVGFTKPDEGYFPIVAGPEGVEALVLNFPRLETARAIVPEASQSQEFRVWQCLLCAFSYDEAKGMPHEGIAPGTRWEDVPDSWTCSDCGTGKADFEMTVVA